MMPQWLKRLRESGHARGDSSRVVPTRAIRASIATLLLVPQLTGCFHHVPINSSMTPVGTEVSVGVTDRGRVALAESVGSGVRRLSGRVLESTDTSLVLSVTSVESFGTSVPTRWTGERVMVSRGIVSDVRERRFSRSRSMIMAGIIAAGAIAVSLIAIAGFGSEPGSDRPPPDNEPQ